MSERRFIKTVSYTVGEMQQGKHAEWLQAARAFYPRVGEGLLAWQLLRERTGRRGYVEMFTFADRDAYQALVDDGAFKQQGDQLLLKQGEAMEEDSLEIRFHDELISETA